MPQDISQQFAHHNLQTTIMKMFSLYVLAFVTVSVSSFPREDPENIDIERYVAIQPRTEPSANAFVDTIIKRFLKSPWFRAMVYPAYFVEGEVGYNDYFMFKNIKVIGLDQPFGRLDDVTVQREGNVRVLNVTLGPWHNLTVEADYKSVGQIAGTVRGAVPELSVSFMLALEAPNTPNFKVTLRDFDVLEHGPFQLTYLSGLWLLSAPARLVSNFMLPAFQTRAEPLIESKVKEIIAMMLEDAQTLVLFRPGQ